MIQWESWTAIGQGVFFMRRPFSTTLLIVCLVGAMGNQVLAQPNPTDRLLATPEVKGVDPGGRY